MEQQIINSLRQSIYRIVLVLVHFLPGVLAFLLALLLFSLAGLALAAILRRVLTGLRFDERLAALGLVAGKLAYAAGRAHHLVGLCAAWHRCRHLRV
jgi:hypothetical protein